MSSKGKVQSATSTRTARICRHSPGQTARRVSRVLRSGTRPSRSPEHKALASCASVCTRSFGGGRMSPLRSPPPVSTAAFVSRKQSRLLELRPGASTRRSAADASGLRRTLGQRVLERSPAAAAPDCHDEEEIAAAIDLYILAGRRAEAAADGGPHGPRDPLHSDGEGDTNALPRLEVGSADGERIAVRESKRCARRGRTGRRATATQSDQSEKDDNPLP